MSSCVPFRCLSLAAAAGCLLFAGRPFLYAAQKTSAAYFLKLPVSADALALGGNAVILGKGVGSLNANPATLGFITQPEFQTSYGPHLEGYKFFNASYGRSGPFLNTGISVTRVAASNFEGRDAQGAPTGSFSAGDTAVNFSAAKPFENYFLGVNLKYISSAIENESASALAFDAGLVFLGDRYEAHPLKFGFSIRNLGTGLKYMNTSEPLPLTAAAAFAVTIAGPVDAAISLSDNLAENALEFGLGMNFNPVSSLSLSGGFSKDIGKAASSGSAPLKLNAGIEFKMSNFALGYGFVPMGDFGSLQRMSVGYRFGEKDGPGEQVRSRTNKRAKTGNKKTNELLRYRKNRK